MAHDPKLDDAALAIALRPSAFYVGALGSARTHTRRIARLKTLVSHPENLRESMGL